MPAGADRDDGKPRRRVPRLGAAGRQGGRPPRQAVDPDRWPARTPGSATSAVAVAGTSTSAVNRAPLRLNATLTSPRAVGTCGEPLVRLAGCGRISTVPQPGVSADTPNRYCGHDERG